MDRLLRSADPKIILNFCKCITKVRVTEVFDLCVLRKLGAALHYHVTKTMWKILHT